MTHTSIDPKTMQRLFMDNPFMSQWLSIANAMAGTVRGFWAAELSRMQASGLQAFNREAMRAWADAWSAAPAAVAARVPEAAAEIVAEVPERAASRAMPAKRAAATLAARPRTPRAKPVTHKPASTKRAANTLASAKRAASRH